MTTTIRPRMAGLTAPDPTGAVEVRRATSGRSLIDVLVLIGAAVAALSLATLLVTRMIPATNMLGFGAIAYLLFVALYGAVVLSREQDGRTVIDRLASVVMHSLALLALLALLSVVGFTFWRGREALPHLNFYTQDMRLAGPLDPLTVGGILHAMVGTLIQITIALLLTVPLGLACAVYLNEASGALARFVRTVVEAMTAVPSILVGLFIFAFILTFGLTRSGLAAGVAIFVMILPIVIRAADVVLRVVPGSLREASLSLGASKWRTAWYVVLPTARSGLTTAVLLGTARGVGEVSPVLITAGFASVLNFDPTSGPMASLPLVTFVFAGSSERTMMVRAFGAAVVLLALVFVLFALARVFGGRPAGELSPRAQRHRARDSQRDLARFTSRHTTAQMGARYGS